MTPPPPNTARASFQNSLWILFLGAAISWYLIFRVVLPLQSEPLRGGALHGNDFKHLYLGAWMLARSEAPFDNPYDARALKELAARRGFGSVNPYVYLPFTGLVLSPLTLLDPPDALVLWFWLNHVFLIAAIVLMFSSLEIQRTLPNIVFAATAAALCYPFHRTLTAGQLNCALLFLFALVYALEKRRHPIAAGAAAAFAFLFKLMPGILGVYFLWNAVRARHPQERRAAWTAALSMFLFSALFMGCAILATGINRHLAFLPLLEQMSYGHSTWAEFGMSFYRDPGNQSLNSLFHHLFAPWPNMTPWVALSPHWANHLTRAMFIICAALVAWQTRPQRQIPDPAPLMPYALFLLLGLLAPSIYWDHYAVIALWALFACWALLPEPTRPWCLALLTALSLLLGALLELSTIGCLALLALSVGFCAGLIWRFRNAGGFSGALWALGGAFLLARFSFDQPAFRHGLGLPAMSLKLWGTLILFALCLMNARRHPASPSKGNA